MEATFKKILKFWFRSLKNPGKTLKFCHYRKVGTLRTLLTLKQHTVARRSHTPATCHKRYHPKFVPMRCGKKLLNSSAESMSGVVLLQQPTAKRKTAAPCPQRTSGQGACACAKHQKRPKQQQQQQTRSNSRSSRWVMGCWTLLNRKQPGRSNCCCHCNNASPQQHHSNHM